MSVRAERHDQTLVVTIDRPDQRNAVDHTVAEGIEAALDEAERADAICSVVITGAGDRAFCAGADLKAVATNPDPSFLVTERGGFAGIVRRRFPKIVIAAVNGAALAGGFEIVLACDLVVAAEHATFGIPEVKRGLVAGAGGLIHLPQRLPLPLALELAVTGDPIDAARAHELGLVNRLVPGEQVLDAALELAATIAANAPIAVRESKAVMLDSLGLDEDGRWERSEAAGAMILQTEDLMEGVVAFAERRPPVWKGR
jgi:enoyl-CoA hydratase/carnithine racemase